MKIKKFYKLKIKEGIYNILHEEVAENIAEAVLSAHHGHGDENDDNIVEVKRVRRSIAIVYFDEGYQRYEAHTYDRDTAIKRFTEWYPDTGIEWMEI